MKAVRCRPVRHGFSLLEILLALSILGGSLAVLSQIAETGSDAAREARALSMARILAQAKLSEVLLNSTLGTTPTPVVEAVAEPFDSQATSDFYYSIEIVPAPLDGMLAIRVSVQARNANGGVQANYQLTRWMIDPALGLEEAEAEEQAAREEAAGIEATDDAGVGT
jgi:prepilin-type N-terminal cleavage/methylation domain-containing protein